MEHLQPYIPAAKNIAWPRDFNEKVTLDFKNPTKLALLIAHCISNPRHIVTKIALRRGKMLTSVGLDCSSGLGAIRQVRVVPIEVEVNTKRRNCSRPPVVGVARSGEHVVERGPEVNRFFTKHSIWS